ncbi:Chromo domain-containing protein [Gossypium australe]|uniref:Chromo domain-containing protein n=1 Tax=Gossypium australe TaxID=47621 RepID=A0A5B6W4E4_9ROSI|nr:Chromo domain-containing protein [Gossypium australe]
MALYEALYGQECRYLLCWTELSEKKLFSTNLIHETEEKVQKSYTDLKRNDIEFQVGNKLFMKVSPWEKVPRFGRKGKLNPRFIGSYEVIKRIGPIAYRFALLSKLEKIYNVFHVLMLWQYQSDPSHEIQPDMSYSEESIQILAWETKKVEK